MLFRSIVVTLFIAKDDLLAEYAYHRFKSVKPGDTYTSVVARMGPGREVPIKEVPGKPSVHSPQHRNKPPHIVPVVEGAKILVWEGGRYKFYVSFDQAGTVLETQALDNKSF